MLNFESRRTSMKKNFTTILLCGSLINSIQIQPMDNTNRIIRETLRKVKEKSEQAAWAFALGYGTGVCLAPGSVAFPVVVALLHIPDNSDARVIIPSALLGHALGYATWGAAFYGTVKFIQHH